MHEVKRCRPAAGPPGRRRFVPGPQKATGGSGPTQAGPMTGQISPRQPQYRASRSPATAQGRLTARAAAPRQTAEHLPTRRQERDLARFMGFHEPKTDRFGVRQIELYHNQRKVYCLLEGPDEEAIRRHHAALGVPCGDVHQVDSLT
jgi:hypothetical protein